MDVYFFPVLIALAVVALGVYLWRRRSSSDSTGGAGGGGGAPNTKPK